jgi:hypothetical protein
MQLEPAVARRPRRAGGAVPGLRGHIWIWTECRFQFDWTKLAALFLFADTVFPVPENCELVV